jgi:hypothetical protein
MYAPESIICDMISVMHVCFPLPMAWHITYEYFFTGTTACHGYNSCICISTDTLLLVKMKEKELLKIQPLPKVLRVQD